MAKGNTKAAQDAATQAPETPDETAADTGEVAQTGAEPAHDNASETANADESAAPLPESVKLAAPYGFIDDETGVHYFWQAGQVVTEATEVQLLVERQAPLE